MRNMKRLSVLVAATLFSAGGWAADIVKDVDVVVVGSGASGMAAAVEAQEAGLKTVLLEKMPTIGGSALYIEGTFAVETDHQKSMYIGLDKDWAYKNHMEFNHGFINGPLIRKWINNSANSIKWMEDHGVTFHDVRTLFEDGYRTWHIFKDGKGVEFVNQMAKSFKQHGGTILTETPGTEIIYEDGKVTGIMAEDAEGETYQFNTQGGVIVAAGGFINNPEYLKKYGIRSDYLIVGPKTGRDGDSLPWYDKVGARLEGMGTHLAIGAWLSGKDPNTQLSQPEHTTVYSQLASLLRQPYMWVANDGKRFIDESQAPLWMNTDPAVERVGGSYFAVFDDTLKDYMINEGIDVSHSDWVRVGHKLDLLEEGLEVGQEEGYVYVSNTIEGLAKKMGVDPVALKKTVEDNNRYAVNGLDEEFPKDRKYVRSISKPPYFAVKGDNATLITLGGPSTNTDMQILREKDLKPVEGMYVVGCEVGGIYGDSYNLTLEGMASSFAINSGRFASQHIAKKLGK